jgi:hypothetical protein
MSRRDEKDTAVPRFFVSPVHNPALSDKEGRPIYEDKEMVEVRLPGDKNFTWVGEVAEEHRLRWPAHYAAYKRNEQRATTGTPLEHWPPMTASRVAELKALNIFSVEELASVTDGDLPRLGMGGRALREQAKAYIDTAKEGAAASKLASENAELKSRIERLEALMTQPAPQTEPESEEKDINELSDEQLKAYIKRETGEGVRGQPSRQTLIERASALAMASEAA